MSKTYCGKDCENCESRELLSCPGCKVGPGNYYGGDCEIAKCCRGTGHESCDTCVRKVGCSSLRGSWRMPEYRRKKQEAQAMVRAEIARKAPKLRLGFRILFLLVIPNALAAILGKIEATKVISEILNTVMWIAYGSVLLYMSTEEERYRAAGFCSLAGGLLGILASVMNTSAEAMGFGALVAIAGSVIVLVGEYKEMHAHSVVLSGVDNDMAEKWTKLWRWYIGAYAATLGSVLVMVISPVLGLLVMLAGAIAVLVVSIVKLVYLNRCARIFSEWIA